METGGIRKKDKVAAFLTSLEDGMIEASELFEQWARRRPYRYEGEHKLAEERYQADRAHRNRLAHLRRRKLVKTKKIEGRLFVELSNKGRVEIKKRSMRERPKLPDSFSCLVLFDFPVDARRGRDAFRQFLKNADFEQVQKSAWRSDRDVIKDVQEFVISSKIETWVEVFLARKQ
jgi:DNA-binding transcriptional regulator PaaX